MPGTVDVDMDHLSMDLQRDICQKYGAKHVPSPPDLKVGITTNVREHIYPLNGLRIMPEGDTTGWYLWAGETLSSDPDFFQPLHVIHIDDWCPEMLPYLGLPPGWRFLIAPDYEDVWCDPQLINDENAPQ